MNVDCKVGINGAGTDSPLAPPVINHFAERLLRFGEVCRRVGLPSITMSPRFARSLLPIRLDDRHTEDEAFPDLVWALRGTVFGLIPCVRKWHEGRCIYQVKFWSKPLVGEPSLQQVHAIMDTSLKGEPRFHLVLPDESDASSGPRPTVLLVEDNVGVAEVLQMLLEAAGFRVLWVANGLEGLRLAQTDSFAAAVLDVDLPGMDGFEVCRQLKADAATRSLPIVFLSGNPNAPTRAVQVGADEVLLKPKGVTQLAACLCRLLSR